MKLMRLSALDILQNAFADQSDYFFVIDKKGNLIMEGQNIDMKKGNILNITDIDGKEFVKELIKSAKTNSNEFVSYKWRNPSTDKIELKYSYVKSVPHSDWIIGSGFYINGVNEQIKLKQHELQVSYQKDYKNLLFFSFLLIGASLIVSYIISIMLKKRFLNYSNDINAKRDELQALNKSLENQVKKRTQELKKAYKEMKKIAITDSLTNIYNRYFFNDALKNEFSRAKRYNSAFALIMFDIDHFKNINDTYGHIKGDEVLKSMTEIIKEHLRVSDVFARTGGEEFMIILPNTNITLATEIAQRIRACVEKYNFNLQSNITISIGVVTHKDNDTHQSILKRVDNALYAAKESGRNSVIVDI
jgi:diguanylate cyclase (GGDEF)-like protein